jgi:endo-1,4-beta-D-glucanase Y
MNPLRTTGIALILVGIVLLGVVLYRNGPLSAREVVFSEKAMLQHLWDGYKKDYLEEGTGRALDKQQENITTSEGQSYTMLRAVWMDDRETFDLAWKWTQDNLRRSDDRLFSWLFGKKADGTYGVLSDRGGDNAATDADVDIAVALLFAHERWGDDLYEEQALEIIEDVWQKEVVIIGDKPYLTANNLEKLTSARPIINPSYFAPYAYRMFGEIDKTHDWDALVDSSYEVLEQSTAAPLDKEKGVLPPDWIVITPTGVQPTNIDGLTTNYSYDALRIPWRIALDYMWYGDERAKRYLDSLSSLSEHWEADGKIASVYSHDGSIVSENEAPAMYGGSIGYFTVSDDENAKEVYEQKLKSLYDQDSRSLQTPLSYYDSNWAWFGIALYNDLLPNLMER